ncbi:MAG: leucine--tRNA ligase [candidate division WS1 bacterium]|nr:leucine--tRNA ligase [candidate division WS1 bacterium]
MRYDHRAVEAKWRQVWEERGYHEPDLDAAARPYYNLMMFPYPSAEGLHVGNVYAFTGADIHGRYKRMCGYDVFEPMGFDAFGIHSENYAIKIGDHPRTLIRRNVRNFRENQLKRIGARFDWAHQVNTTEPEYYRWTQWVFIRMFEQGLAYRKKAAVNWCPSCMTVLADEQVIADRCERCDALVTQRELDQWFFRITDYAERLHQNLDTIDWSEITKTAQRNWINRSEGALLRFQIDGRDDYLEVFTTRPDTIFGATYMVMAPEHPLVDELTASDRRDEVAAYRAQVRETTQEERVAEDRPKTGVDIGAHCINPATGERIPIWIADYVLWGYGTGAIMAVPAHDERDFAFATTFGLPIREVISPDGESHEIEAAYIGPGVMINSPPFDGTPSAEGMSKVTQHLAERGLGEPHIEYRLRDWCISRQRYWGPPIPMIHCKQCGPVPVPEEQLPVLLPDLENFAPDDSGRPPLARAEEWVNVPCPQCGAPARRDADVSDNFLCSAFYFLRYPSVGMDHVAWDPERTRRWLPVDMYIGGNEHACLHLMYTRFLTMALYDAGLVPFEEPFRKFRAHGLLAKDGAKMSKSKGNVVNPDELLNSMGADTLRLYLMFCGPFQQGGDWRDEGIAGMRRFVERLFNLVMEGEIVDTPVEGDLERVMHAAIKKVGEDLDGLRYNTAIAATMELSNAIRDSGVAQREAVETLLKLVAPLAPFVTEELWHALGHEGTIHDGPWPEYDPAKLVADTVDIPIQVKGKLRGTVTVPTGASEQEVLEAARSIPAVATQLEGKEIRKVIFLPGKLMNIVV